MSEVKKNSIDQEVEQLYDEKMEHLGKQEVKLQQKQQKVIKQKEIGDDVKETKYFKTLDRQKEKVVVQLDTVVPALPGKSERVKLPDQDSHYDKLDKLDDNKQKLWDHFKKYAKEIKNKAFQGKEGSTDGNLLKVLKEKQAERKVLRESMKIIKADFDITKKELEDIWEKQSKMRLKMKRLMKKDELLIILEDLKFKQANQRLSLSEEKVIIKEIQDLQDSLPFAEPLEELEQKRHPLKKKKDLLRKQMTELWEKIQKYNKQIEELSRDFDIIKKSQNEQFDNMDPAITTKKAETQEEVEQIRQTKKNQIKEYNDQLDKYDEQQILIKKVEWMTLAKQRLIKLKQQMIEDEKNRIQQEEERKEINDNVYSEEITMCESLIRYCRQFQKKEETQKQDIEKQEIKKNNLENEKLQVVKCKRDIDNDFQKPKEKKKKVQKVQQEEKKDDNKIIHKFELLATFEQMKILAPTKNKIDETIKALEEKKQYFIEQNEVKKQQNVDVIEEEKKKIREREDQRRNKQKEDEKKNKQKKQKLPTNIIGEEYPEMLQ